MHTCSLPSCASQCDDDMRVPSTHCRQYTYWAANQAHNVDPVGMLVCLEQLKRSNSGLQGEEAFAANLFTYATSQINYMLGDAGRSYVIGFGKQPPSTPFHKW